VAGLMTPSAANDEGVILAINSGSSSLKLGFFKRRDGDEQEVLRGSAENIGRDDGELELRAPDGQIVLQQNHLLETQQDALSKLVKASRDYLQQAPVALGHRVVHGGPDLTTHQLLTPSLLKTLHAAEHFAPLHIPQAIELIEHANVLFPHTPAVACFDTAFHQTMPEVAWRFPLPAELSARGIRKYGFHGLSYESIVHRLANRLPPRAVLAHLGSGCSLCALRDGVSVDTTMGLTPTGGVPMSTRSGDLDPGVMLFLMRSEKMNADALEQMLNRRAGLQALSAGESDMKTLLTLRKNGNQPASLAVAVFATAVRKAIGAYAALLGGIDLLVFTGGMGEHSEEIRKLICEGLDFLGLSLQTSSDRILAMPTEEERQIARVTRAIYAGHR
jgi:acetate kinase